MYVVLKLQDFWITLLIRIQASNLDLENSRLVGCLLISIEKIMLKRRNMK